VAATILAINDETGALLHDVSHGVLTNLGTTASEQPVIEFNAADGVLRVTQRKPDRTKMNLQAVKSEKTMRIGGRIKA